MAHLDPNYSGILMNVDRGSVFSPFHWEMGMSEMGHFLLTWGWALNIKPPPYIVDEASWQLMNKINKRNPEKIELSQISQQEIPDEIKELFEQLINRK